MEPLPSKLIVHRSTGDVYEVTIYTVPFLIGRAPECHLTLDENAISRRHARIDRAFQQYILSDLGSTNGTFVNDTPITTDHVLGHGDVIRFAETVIAYFEDPQATTELSPKEASRPGIAVHEPRKEVRVNGLLIDPPLSVGQYRLLALLVRHEGQIVSRDQMANEVWPDQTDISDQMIDARISRLRTRLATYGADKFIVTRRGFGYIYTTNVE